MATATSSKSKTMDSTNKMGDFFGQLYSFNTSLKLFHWHVTGEGSYAQHMALDQALDDLGDSLDRIVETSYSLNGDIQISIPKTDTPKNIVQHAQMFYDYVQDHRKLFKEDFTAAILDDYQEAIQQLLYRLRRLQ